MIAGVALLTYGLLLPQTMAQDPGPFDWPQWRGPHRDGISAEKNLLPLWPENGPRLVWKVDKLGGGYSTPSVSRGMIFGMSYRAGEEVIWALDEKTGKEQWVTPIGPRGKLLYNEGPRSSPTEHDGRVYALGVRGDVICLNAATGSMLWRRDLPEEFEGRMMSNWGFCESPLVDGEQVLVTPGSDRAAIVALDRRSGKEIWRSAIPDSGGAGYSSIMPVSLKSIKMYVTWLGMKKDVQGKWVSGKGLVGVEATTGRFLWSYSRIANGTANIPTVLVQGDHLFCSNGYPDGGTSVLRVHPEQGGARVEEIAHQPAKVLQNHHGGMVALGGYVYLGNGQKRGLPCCVDFRTAAIQWSHEPLGRGSASVCAADGKVIFRYEDGTVALIEASPKAYRLLGQFKLPAPSDKPGWSHPVVANGRLLLRDQDVLNCYDLRKEP